MPVSAKQNNYTKVECSVVKCQLMRSKHNTNAAIAQAATFCNLSPKIEISNRMGVNDTYMHKREKIPLVCMFFLNVSMYVRTYVCMYLCIHVYVYVYVYVYVCL